MYRGISIRNKNISVRLQENRICIKSDEQLLGLVTQMPEAATDELIAAIKKEFYLQFNKDFGVDDNSMAVEIWGHVFTERFAEAVKALSPVKIVDDLAEKISSHCEVINIGKKEHDRNRFVWDLLATFKPAIAVMLLRGD